MRNEPQNPKKCKNKALCDMARMADEPQSTDVLGSYTGMAKDGDAPVQDADDL